MKEEREEEERREREERIMKKREKREEREDHSTLLFSSTPIAISSPVKLIETHAHDPFHEEFPGYS